MNGEPVSYDLRAPMSWQDFKALPPDIMKLYVAQLKERFHLNGALLADCMGVTASTVSKVLTANGVVLTRNGDGRPSPKMKDAALRFFSGEDDLIEEDTESEDTESEDTENKDTTGAGSADGYNTIKMAPASRMQMPSFSLQFTGPFDSVSFLNSIKLMIPEGTVCNIKIEAEKGENTDV